jgi:hypothetical protein
VRPRFSGSRRFVRRGLLFAAVREAGPSPLLSDKRTPSAPQLKLPRT